MACLSCLFAWPKIYVPKWLIYSQNHAVRKLLRSRHNNSHAYKCKVLVPLENVRPRHAAREMASIGQIWRAQIDTKCWGKNALQSYVLRFGALAVWATFKTDTSSSAWEKTNKKSPRKNCENLVIWILPLNVKPCWSLKKVVRFVSPRHRLAIAETCSCIPKRALRKCWKGQLSSGQAQNQMPFERDQINIKSWSNHSFQL